MALGDYSEEVRALAFDLVYEACDKHEKKQGVQALDRALRKADAAVAIARVAREVDYS